jgi:7-carboxy-7-deazaguanine synthase
MGGSFLVNEIYPCLQGEGPNLGKSSLLVRFQICNLRCTWCDTPYTHTFRSDPVSEGSSQQKFKRYNVNDLCETIHSFSGAKHLILSGGEPTLHNLALLKLQLGDDFTAEVESNGTRIPHKEHPNFSEADYALFQWNISPKGKNAGEKWVNESLHHWAQLSKDQSNVYFKFVVRKDYQAEDLAEVSLFESQFQPAPGRIYLMSEGTTVESQVGQTWLHDLCLARGYHYSPRLHVLLFGAKRGV